MRRSFFVALLLGSTALVSPKPVQAAPVVGFIQGVIAAASGSALIGGTVAAAGFTQGVIFAGTTFGAFAVQSVVSLGLSALSASLAPKPQLPPPSVLMANYAQSLQYMETVYGRVRKGGPIGFTGFRDGADVVTGKAGKKRHISIVAAGHSIEGVVEHYLDELPVEVDSDGTVNTYPMEGFYRIRPFTGDVSQVVDPELKNSFPEITDAHDFAGLSGAHMWLARTPESKFQEVHSTAKGRAYLPVIDGHNGIFDPRDSQFKYTDNAALVIAHWLNSVHGKDVDWDEVALEADEADVMVLQKDGSERKRWTLGGVIRSNTSFESQRSALAIACDAFFYERSDGKAGFKVGRWIEPDLTLTDADFLSCQISMGEWGADAPTEIACKYTEPENNWRETSSGVVILDASVRKSREEPEAFFISNHNQAYRMNVRLGAAKRPTYQLQGTLKLVGMALRGKRTVRVVHAGLGVDAVFEIGKLVRNDGGVTWELSANSSVQADHEPDPASEPDKPVLKQVESDDTVNVLGGLIGETPFGGAIRFRWAEQDASVTQQVRYREVGEVDWQTVAQAPNTSTLLDPRDPVVVTIPTQVTVTGLLDNAQYEAQFRNITAAQRPSVWVPEDPILVTVTANTVAPGAVEAFAVSAAVPDAEITFTAPNDPNFSAVRIYRSLTSNFEDSVLVRTQYGLPGHSGEYVDTALSDGTYQYWIEPINQSGLSGPLAGPEAVTITTA